MTEPVDPDTAIALRQVHAFPATRTSVFEDPADEKSSHASQRYSSLIRYYGERDPSWYDSVTQEFQNLGRVLDLGSGPGLSLASFSAQGVREPIGIDRWQGFLRDAEAAGRTVMLHDLTLPMPFFSSGSFDGIFSHFALDYISPIGVEQTLREARRLLVRDGLMVLYLGAAGVALGDRTRTTPYDEAALARLLASTGFEDFEIEQPADRRNTVVRARGPGAEQDHQDPSGPGAVLDYEAGGEIQVMAGIRPLGATEGEPVIGIEVSNGERSIGYWPGLPSPAAAVSGDATLGMSVCARLVAFGPHEFELQVWTWQGSHPTSFDAIRLQTRPELIRLRCESDAGTLEHHDCWRPRPPMVEVPGNAYTSVAHASPPHRPDEEWRVRGREVIIEEEGTDPDALDAAAESKDHLVVHRPDLDAPAEIETLEREWKEARLHGLVLEMEAALRPKSLPLLLWAGFRGALVYLEPDSWAAVERGAPELPAGIRTPLLVVDPALSGRGDAQAEVEAPPETIAAALDETPGLHLVLSARSAERAGALSERYPTRVLIGGSGQSADGPVLEEATENLRYLTERTSLMWFRGTSGKTASELGRWAPQAAA
jgi:SAM-dependent methyltransferase